MFLKMGFGLAFRLAQGCTVVGDLEDKDTALKISNNWMFGGLRW